jgi:hypothetical protein
MTKFKCGALDLSACAALSMTKFWVMVSGGALRGIAPTSQTRDVGHPASIEQVLRLRALRCAQDDKSVAGRFAQDDKALG